MRFIVFTMLLTLIGDANAAETIELPSFGVTAPIPDGWRRVREPDEALAARWEFGDGKSKEPEGLIDLLLYPKRMANSVKALAQKEARRLGGQLNPESVELGGVEAVEFVMNVESEDKKTVTPHRVRMIKHAGGYYALCERAATETTKDAYDKIASEMKFADPTEPSDALRDRDDAISLPAVNLFMGLPDPYRCVTEGAKRQEYSIINFASGQTEAHLTIAPISLGKESFDTILPSLGKSLARQHGWANPPTWHRVAGKVSVAYTDLIPAGKDERGKAVSPMQLMLIQHNGAAQMLIVQYTASAEATAKYARHWEHMAISVRVEAKPRT